MFVYKCNNYYSSDALDSECLCDPVFETPDFTRSANISLSRTSLFTDLLRMETLNSVPVILENSYVNVLKYARWSNPSAHSHPSVMFAQKSKFSGLLGPTPEETNTRRMFEFNR